MDDETQIYHRGGGMWCTAQGTQQLSAALYKDLVAIFETQITAPSLHAHDLA